MEAQNQEKHKGRPSFTLPDVDGTRHKQMHKQIKLMKNSGNQFICSWLQLRTAQVAIFLCFRLSRSILGMGLILYVTKSNQNNIAYIPRLITYVLDFLSIHQQSIEYLINKLIILILIQLFTEQLPQTDKFGFPR